MKKNTAKTVGLFVEASGGGVLSVIKDSIEILQNTYPNKYKFTIVYSTREDTPANIEKLFAEVKFIPLQMGSKAFEKSDLSTIIKLRSMLKNFDFVHFHSSRAGFLGRIAISTIIKKPKSFYSPHCFGFLNLEFSNAKRKLIWIIEYLLSKTSSTRFMACGPSEYEIAKSISKNSVLVTNGFTPEATNFGPPSKQPKKVFEVVGSGRNVLQKDPGFFIKIAKANKNKDINFTWVGNIDADIATGWLPREEAYRKLNNANVFLATSLWEGLPVNGIEALSLGIPLLVRNTSSYIDLVEHGKNGFIYETKEEALQYLNLMYSNHEILEQLSINAKQSAQTRFSKQNYLKLYELYGE